MKRVKLPYEEHATSRYMCVSESVIDKLQRDYFAGRDLDRFVPNISETKAAVIVAESLEADRAINLPPDKLFDGWGPYHSATRAAHSKSEAPKVTTSEPMVDGRMGGAAGWR